MDDYAEPTMSNAQSNTAKILASHCATPSITQLHDPIIFEFLNVLLTSVKTTIILYI